MTLSFTSLLGNGGAQLLNALVLYLTRPALLAEGAGRVDTQLAPRSLRRGDVLLTSGNTRAARLIRRITGSPWAHVCMYVGPLAQGEDPPCIVEADIAAGVRAIRCSELDGQRVQVLRPVQLPEADRARLADWVISRIGDRYDLGTAFRLGARLLHMPRLGRVPSASDVAEGAKRFICSSLLAQAFLFVGHPIMPAQVRARAASTSDYWQVTPRDFERASGFEVVDGRDS
jgi:hypothetical protein